MSIGQTATVVLRSGVPLITDRGVDRIFAVLAGWLMTGVFLDAWAHISGLPDSFWTPWHGVLYSGLLACGASLVLARVAERTVGRPILGAGYEWSLVGVAIAAIGGMADAVWHTLFGVEFDIEAAVSPSHLLVAGGIFLVVTGPARAAWAKRTFGPPAALSLLYGLSILAVILDYADPFTRVFGARPGAPTHALLQVEQGLALFAFLSYAVLVSGVIQIALARVAVAPAYIAFVVGGNALVMVLVNSPLLGAQAAAFVAVALVGGALAGVAAAWLDPSPARPAAFRVFAFLVPTLLFVLYAASVIVGPGTSWSPTFWSGLIVSSGLAGLLLSTLVLGRPRG
jgi:hypothetical protein